MDIDVVTVVQLLTVLVAAFLLWKVLRRLFPRRGSRDFEVELPRIDVTSRKPKGPPIDARIEVYHVPMRLVAVIIAPVGRDATLPEDSQVRILIGQLIPGMQAILARHQPEIIKWPAQLSSQGFIPFFFRHAELPNEDGKGTPWTNIAGKYEVGTSSYLVGLTCCSSESNQLGTIALDRPAQWLDVVRAKIE